MTDATMIDAAVAEELGDLDNLDSMQEDYTKDDRMLTNVQCHDEDDNTILLSMKNHGAQVPRLMRIYFYSWYKEKCARKNLVVITEDFEAETKVYYSDVCTLIRQFKVSQFAQFLLACSVYHKPMGNYLLPGEFNVKDSMDKSIIFLYAVEYVLNEKANLQPDTCFMIPCILFLYLNSVGNDILSTWQAVQ
jgi:hypothetical protein